MDRIGMHVIRSRDAIPMLRQAAQVGRPFRAVLSVNQPTLASEIKNVSPSTIVITRFTGDEAWGYGARLERGDDPKAVAFDLFKHIMAGKNILELQAADYIAFENEPDPAGPVNYERLARASIELGRIVSETYGKKLAHLGLNAGTPEWSEILAMRDAGLFDYLRQSGNCLNVHEGVIPPTEMTPILRGWGDTIPGAPEKRAYVAGSMAMRHEYLWLAAGGEVFDILVGEFYPGGGTSKSADPADIVARCSWYNSKLRKRVIAFLPFTLDAEGGWADQEMNRFYPAIIQAKKESAPVTEVKQAVYTRGIDVSKHQQDVIDWTKVKVSGVEFAFMRVAYGLNKDIDWPTFWPGAKKAGILRGAYHYFMAGSGQAQADLFLAQLGKDTGELPCALDLEEKNIDYAAYMAQAKIWLDVVERATGRRPLLYVGPAAWSSLYGKHAPWASGYQLWIGNPPLAGGAVPQWANLINKTFVPDVPVTWGGNWRIWQYAWQGVVPGAGAPIDLDVFNGSLQDLINWAGVPMPTTPAPAVKVLTWQGMINAIYRAGKKLGYPQTAVWDWMVVRGGVDIYSDKAAPYLSETPEELNWSAKEIAAVKDEIAVVLK